MSDSASPWTIACQAPQSKELSRQGYWNGLPFPSPGDLPDPGIEPGSPTLQADSLPSEPPGKLLGGRFLTTGPPAKSPVESSQEVFCMDRSQGPFFPFCFLFYLFFLFLFFLEINLLIFVVTAQVFFVSHSFLSFARNLRGCCYSPLGHFPTSPSPINPKKSHFSPLTVKSVAVDKHLQPCGTAITWGSLSLSILSIGSLALSP